MNDETRGRVNKLLSDGGVKSEPRRFYLPLPICCVYLLVKDGAVVYVGQTLNLYERLWQHVAGRRHIFDEIYYVPVLPTDLNTVEEALSQSLRPIGNSPRKAAGAQSRNPGDCALKLHSLFSPETTIGHLGDALGYATNSRKRIDPVHISGDLSDLVSKSLQRRTKKA